MVYDNDIIVTKPMNPQGNPMEMSNQTQESISSPLNSILLDDDPKDQVDMQH